tara:strand:+ start:51 stop:449 length:399 start_codon:yes stop_codon:yes gene_type:complete
MTDLKLFQTQCGALCELESSSAPLEKGLQMQFENNLDTLLGVRFLASEYSTTRFYLAYRRIKNYACVEVRPTLNQLKIFLKIDPDSVELVDGFSRGVRKIGHFGTGDLELTIGSHEDFERAKPLILRSYEES